MVSDMLLLAKLVGKTNQDYCFSLFIGFYDFTMIKVSWLYGLYKVQHA